MTPSTRSSLVGRLDALYEFDREPVADKDRHGWKVFWATFAGEHIAGTEFVIGPLFVLHGCTATAVLLGLFLGDLLAVLSWAFVCAPTAVRTRLTIYWSVRRLGGPWLNVAYSAAYGIILCVLAGSMLRVSMTAIALPLHSLWPGSLPPALWLILAIAVGSVIAVLAVLGFEGMAVFSKFSAPWMVVLFLSAGLAALPLLGCHTPGEFWTVAKHRIWTGRPSPGFSHYTIWHVIGFAWLCNLPQHFGMADLTILRFARKWQMGFCSSAGMYLGHYCAWVCSGILCAAAVAHGVATDPGPIAVLGAGLAGALCVVIAGWNVASPTIYRAGLALQAATPNWRRWAVTLAVAAAMIACACVPALLTHLDLLLTTNALILVPPGAFILIDVWVLPRLGLAPNYAEATGAVVSWPGAAAWLFSMAFSLAACVWAGANPIFLALPEWALAAVLYLALIALQQRR